MLYKPMNKSTRYKIATAITAAALAIGSLVSQQQKDPTNILNSDSNIQYTYVDQEGVRVWGVLDDKATLKATARTGKYRVEKTAAFYANPPVEEEIYSSTEQPLIEFPDWTQHLAFLPFVGNNYVELNWPDNRDRTARWRPAPGSVSTGSPKVTAGTLGGPICYGDNCNCFLTNSHVAGGLEGATIGEPMLQPGPYHGGTMDDKIAEVVAIVAPKKKVSNTVDAAIACWPDNSTIYPEIYGIGKVTHVAEDPQIGSVVTKCGVRTGCTLLTLKAKEVTVKIGYYTSGSKLPQMYTFTHQYLYSGVSDGGDSGSHIIAGELLLVQTEDGAFEALLFAGNGDGEVMANSAEYLFQAIPEAYFPGMQFIGEAYP